MFMSARIPEGKLGATQHHFILSCLSFRPIFLFVFSSVNASHQTVLEQQLLKYTYAHTRSRHQIQLSITARALTAAKKKSSSLFFFVFIYLFTSFPSLNPYSVIRAHHTDVAFFLEENEKKKHDKSRHVHRRSLLYCASPLHCVARPTETLRKNTHLSPLLRVSVPPSFLIVL
jgi:hypothetical protein